MYLVYIKSCSVAEVQYVTYAHKQYLFLLYTTLQALKNKKQLQFGLLAADASQKLGEFNKLTYQHTVNMMV